MRRTRESDEESERPRKQATLGAFFRRADGEPVSAPKSPSFTLNCPFCPFVASSSISMQSLPGALKVHVSLKHPDDYLEGAIRLHAAISAVHTTIFDFDPMELIREDLEDSMEVDDGTEARTPKPKRLRHSYSVKRKYKYLQAIEKAEERVKASIGPSVAYFTSTVLEEANKATGVPTPTLKIVGRGSQSSVVEMDGL